MRFNETRTELGIPPPKHQPDMEFDSVEESLRNALRHGPVQGSSRLRPDIPSHQNHHEMQKRHNYVTVQPEQQRTVTLQQQQQQQQQQHFLQQQEQQQYSQQQQQLSPHSRGYVVDPTMDPNHHVQSPHHHPPEVVSPNNNHHPMSAPQPAAIHQNGTSVSVDDFRKYCVFLTERMQKMEEQNDQLARIAEQQKHEYNKVAAQIAQSELMQRRLQHECTNLRRQVHQLSTYNQHLQEVTLPSPEVTSQTQTQPQRHPDPAAPIAVVDDRSLIEQQQHHLQQQQYLQQQQQQQQQLHHKTPPQDLSFDSMQSLRSGFHQTINEALIARTKDIHPNRQMSHVRPDEIATIVDLYNALQRSTPPRVQPSPPEIVGEPCDDVTVSPKAQVLDVIHEQPENSKQSLGEHSDYATPSGVCATQACDCCSNARQVPKVGGSKPPAGRPRDIATSPPKKPAHARVSKLGRSPRGSAAVERSQSFDNNAYIEVELKHYESGSASLERPNLQSQLQSEADPAKASFRRDNRLRRSHNHYMNVSPSKREPQRPSSLVLDLDTVQAAMDEQQAAAQGIALSPVSPYENSPLFSRSFEGYPSASRKRTPVSPQNQPDGRIWHTRGGPCTSQSEERLTSADSGHVTSPGSPPISGSRRSYSKLDFAGDLPPPPPPPPQQEENTPENNEVSPRPTTEKARTESDPLPKKQETTSKDAKKSSRSAFSQIRPRKLSLWKQRNNNNGTGRAPGAAAGSGGNPASPDADGAKAAGWRRKSYAAACRKSQSLDHLYDQILMENGRQPQNQSHRGTNAADKAQLRATTFSTLQNHQKRAPSPSPVKSAEDALPGSHQLPVPTEADESVFLDDEDDVSNKVDEPLSDAGDFPPPPPQHLLQEVMTSDGRGTGYAVMMPLDADPITHEAIEKSPATSPKEPASPPAIAPKSLLLQRGSSKSETSIPQKLKLSLASPIRANPSAPGLRVPDFGAETPASLVSRLPKSSTSDAIKRDCDAIDEGLRRRRMSEGSVGRRRKDLLEQQKPVDTSTSQAASVRRRRSISSDFALNKRRETDVRESSRARESAASPPSASPPQQPRFPSTNPHVRPPSGSIGRNNSAGGNSTHLSPQSSPAVSRAARTESLESGSSISQCSQATERRPLVKSSSKLSISAKPGTAAKKPDSKPQERGRAASKASASGKKSKDAAPKKRNSSGGGSGQSRSLVDIMKSKFGRSTSSGRTNSSGSKTELAEARKQQESDPQIKPSSSLIDPRTLSLEPNSYLNPGKDIFSSTSSSVGSNKKKKSLGGSSDAAVGRKLSQPYPNGLSTACVQPLSKLVEEVVSDEGFAEGSTIERPDKDQPREVETIATPASERKYVETSFPAENFNSSQQQQQQQHQQQQRRRLPKKENSDWYESVVTVQSDKEHPQAKRFQIVEQDRLSRRGSGKQRHAAAPSVPMEEPPYENLPFDPRQVMPQQINTFTELNNNIGDEKLSHHAPSPHHRDVFAAGVTIVRTPPSQGVSPDSTQSRKSAGGPKLASAIGRVAKSPAQYSGSKEDLSSVRSSDSFLAGAPAKSKKPDKDLSGRKINYSAHQKVFEKAFISSVVEAQLAQASGDRGSPQAMGGSTPDSSPLSQASSGADSVMNGSVGTGSSFGSLPSDGLVDVTEFQGTTSSGSSEPSSKPSQRLSKSKRNSSSGFGFSGRAGKTGTNGSNTSTSSSERSFRGRSRTSSSGLPRSPAVSTPPAPTSTVIQLKESRSSSCVSYARDASPAIPPDYHHSASKQPPAYSEPSADNKALNAAKSLQSRRSQSGSRISRITAPSKLPSPGKGSRSQSTSSQDGASPKPQSPKVKLAPLNYGFPPSRARAPSNGRQNEPVYENSSVLMSQQAARKGRAQATSLRQPTVSSSTPTSSRPPSGSSASQLEQRRLKRNIPSAVGLQRPRAVNLGVGAG